MKIAIKIVQLFECMVFWVIQHRALIDQHQKFTDNIVISNDRQVQSVTEKRLNRYGN